MAELAACDCGGVMNSAYIELMASNEPIAGARRCHLVTIAKAGLGAPATLHALAAFHQRTPQEFARLRSGPVCAGTHVFSIRNPRIEVACTEPTVELRSIF